MNLRQYLEKEKISIPKFAKLIGSTPRHLQRIVYGGNLPSLKIAIKILEVTYGKVTLKELIDYIPETETVTRSKRLLPKKRLKKINEK